MRKLKLMLAMMLMAMSVGFTACGDDDDDKSDSNGNSGGTSTQEQIQQQSQAAGVEILPKKVTKIVTNWTHNGEERSYSTNLNYDAQGRLVTIDAGDQTTTFTYGDNDTITVKYVEHAYVYISKYKLEDGRLASELSYEKDGTFRYERKYSYTSDGYLKIYDDEIYTFEDGKLTKIDAGSSVWTFEYGTGSVPNNLNLDCMAGYTSLGWLPCDDGLNIGKRSAYLPTKASNKDGSGVCDYVYELDGNYIKKITEVYTEVYDGKTERYIYTYTFFYE